MAFGYVALVLHAHLPFVRHPESDYVLEEEWLYEAITETYIPLLQVFEGLKRDGIDFKMTMSMTPPLVSMLRDPLLQERYEEHLGKLEELIAKEIDHNQHTLNPSKVSDKLGKNTIEIWSKLLNNSLTVIT